MRTALRWIIVTVIVAGVGFGVYWFFFHKGDTNQVVFKYAPVKEGKLTSYISATGTIQPEDVIDVGAQVAGRIMKFGLDATGKHEVDYSSQVREGELLAEIDPVVYQSNLASANAQLLQANAGVERAVADLAVAEAKFNLADRDWKRATDIRKNGGTDAISQSQYDQYESAFESATAGKKVSEAAVKQARATVAQAQAAVERADRELGYCTIKTPVTGVVISRRVNIGQTVVASLNAPSLFLIAKDLKKMEVWVPVNEVDIGQVHEKQSVSFSVDSIPDREFEGKVIKARYEPVVTQNVVTYTVEVSVDNSDEALRPYTSANVKFKTNERNNVMYVPNAALRYTPPVEQMIPSVREKYAALAASGGNGGPAPAAPAAGPPAAKAAPTPGTNPTTKPAGKKARAVRKTIGTIWVAAEEDLVKPIEVHVGMTDGANTEISGEGIKPNLQVVIGEQPRAEEPAAGGTNPFAPQRRSTSGGSRPRG